MTTCHFFCAAGIAFRNVTRTAFWFEKINMDPNFVKLLERQQYISEYLQWHRRLTTSLGPQSAAGRR